MEDILIAFNTVQVQRSGVVIDIALLVPTKNISRSSDEDGGWRVEPGWRWSR
jgi:hypothetical protein